MIHEFWNWLESYRSLRRQRSAQKRLAEIVSQTAESYEVRQYRERRAAALKGLALRRQKMEAQG